MAVVSAKVNRDILRLKEETRSVSFECVVVQPTSGGEQSGGWFSGRCRDRIVFINPGTITLGKKQMLRGGKSRPRNKVILNMLTYIGVGERAGSGVPSIYAI